MFSEYWFDAFFESDSECCIFANLTKLQDSVVLTGRRGKRWQQHGGPKDPLRVWYDTRSIGLYSRLVGELL